MCGIVRNVVRVGIIAALAGGAAVVVAGPDRVAALFHQTRDKINQAIDANIDDPVALRAQLRTLEAEYPKRIADVRGDLAELQAQSAQLERDLEVSRRVVALAGQDLDQMQSLLTKAEDARVASGQPCIVRVRFNDRSMNMDEAYAKANSITQVQQAYQQRVTDTERDLGYLRQQEERLGDLLATLESERASFQAQLWQLDRQVDAIARNERMIDLMEDRQDTLDKYSDRYKVASLDQLHGRLADIRARQEAMLESLANATKVASYEERAKYDLDQPRGLGSVRSVQPEAIEIAPPVLEIGPDEAPAAKPALGRSIASSK